jgi:sulfide:quinone oxidoreductase
LLSASSRACCLRRIRARAAASASSPARESHAASAPGRNATNACTAAVGIPASKAGSVARFEGGILARDIIRYLAGEPLDAAFDGHAGCFIESGPGKALLIGFSYDTGPLTGRFPGVAGPPLLRESRLGHLGKLAFGWPYWHVLLPGREIPAVRSQVPAAGKHRPAASPR